MSRFKSLSGVKLALALLLILAWTAAPCHAERRMEVGVSVHMGDYPLDVTQSALDALDVGFRGDVPWKDIEVSPGKLQYPTSSSPLKNLDTLVMYSVQRQHKPMLILAYGNKAYDGGGLVTSPQGIAAFANYAAFVATHFKGRVNDFEIWNEWNHGLGSPPGHKVSGDARQYVNLLRASYQRIKAVNPQARVIGGAVAGTDTAWITDLAEAQGLSYMDGISVHPYVHCNARTPRPPADLKLSGGLFDLPLSGPAIKIGQTQSGFNPVSGTPEQSIAWLDQLKELLDKYSPSRAIPVYVTEIGWPTSGGQCGVLQATAAAYLQRFMLLAAARPWIAGVWWYDLFDDGDDPGNREYRFGLSGRDRSPKPAYRALSAINDLITSSQTPSQKFGANGAIVITGSSTSGKSFSASWLPTDSFDASQSGPPASKAANQGFSVRSSGPVSNSTAPAATPLVMIQQ